MPGPGVGMGMAEIPGKQRRHLSPTSPPHNVQIDNCAVGRGDGRPQEAPSQLCSEGQEPQLWDLQGAPQNDGPQKVT